MSQKKMRADQLLFERGLAESREAAKRLVMAGKVFLVRGEQKDRLDKPGRQLTDEVELFVEAPERFVSRGAYKLLTALDHFSIDVTDFIVLDAGASTGGFTDCLLQHGAQKVFAVDVGYGQLHTRLRSDPRVVCMEKVNIRHASPELILEPVDFLTADVSFISLTQILPACAQFMRPQAEAVVLVKPQFELGPNSAPKGVVRDPALQQHAVDIISDFLKTELGAHVLGVIPAQIKGPKGNQEYLLYFRLP